MPRWPFSGERVELACELDEDGVAADSDGGERTEARREGLAKRLIRASASSAEATFTTAWSLGELAYSLRRPDHLVSDPHRDAVIADISDNGLYRTTGPPQRVVPNERGQIRLSNPYRYVGDRSHDPIIGHLRHRQRRRRRRLLVVCHCYALPAPWLMDLMFGLDQLGEHDVVYNVMNHHYRGSFVVWPGFGLASPRMSRMLESARSAIVGLQTLIEALIATYGYEHVTVLGYSIGGFLALHLANLGLPDRVVAYCPVTSLEETCRDLGLMRIGEKGVTTLVRGFRKNFDFADLRLLDPLAQPMALAEQDLLVVAQQRDQMVRAKQVTRIRTRHPGVQWLELGGTHVWFADHGELVEEIRKFVTR